MQKSSIITTSEYFIVHHVVRFVIINIAKRTNKRKNERTNERKNERTNERKVRTKDDRKYYQTYRSYLFNEKENKDKKEKIYIS